MTATAYSLERRSVLRALANMLEHALSNGDGWLYEDGDDAGIRRREKIVRKMILKLRADAARIGVGQ